MKTRYMLITLSAFLISFAASAQTYFWTETFNNGCLQLCTTYTGTNGAWTFTSNGPANACGGATTPNIFYISCAENGMMANGCGAGCGSDASLHVGNDPLSPSAGFFCPTGDCGAAYDAGGYCDLLSTPPSVITDIKAASPTINCTGRTNISISFNYIEFGQGTNDNATVQYYDGATWTQLVDMPKTPCCGGACNGTNNGRWGAYTIALPASADNNPNVAIAFRWVNDDDGTGTDPSFAVDSVRLSVPGAGAPPLAAFIASSTFGCDNVCTNFTDQSTGAPTSWSWSFPGGVPATSAFQNPTNICYSTPGTYTVTLVATNAFGNDSQVSTNYITVTPTPVPVFTVSNQNICAGDCINFTDQSINSPANWLWTFNGGTPGTSSLQTPPAICYNTPGSYDVTLVATTGICSATTTLTNYITVTAPPVAAFSASNTTICPGDCINFTDASTGSPSGWVWTFSGANQGTSTSQNPSTICYDTSGMFAVTLVASSGSCSNTNTQMNYITVQQAPVANFTASSQSICVDDCIDLTDLSTNGPSNWSWTFAGGNPPTSSAQNPTNICYSVAGAFTITLVASNGTCANTLSQVNYVTVNQPAVPAVNISGDTLTSSVAVLYQWYNSAGAITGAFFQSYVATQPGYYHVCITDAFGCTNCSDSVYFNPEGIEENDFSKSFNVYPVPSSGYLFIENLNRTNQKVELTIKDVTGRIVFRKNLDMNKSQNKISIAELSSGNYFLHLNMEGNKSSFIKKIVKE